MLTYSLNLDDRGDVAVLHLNAEDNGSVVHSMCIAIDAGDLMFQFAASNFFKVERPDEVHVWEFLGSSTRPGLNVDMVQKDLFSLVYAGDEESCVSLYYQYTSQQLTSLARSILQWYRSNLDQ